MGLAESAQIEKDDDGIRVDRWFRRHHPGLSHGAVEKLLRTVPGVELKTVETSCCGMAGSFGYEAEHAEVSKAMAWSDRMAALWGPTP